MCKRAHPIHVHPPAPGLVLQVLELRAIWKHCAGLATLPLWSTAASGDGHCVLVLPGLATGDATTLVLRRFLRSRGFDARGWGQGLNLGLREGVVERAHDTLVQMWAESGRKVSLVGWILAASTHANSPSSRLIWCAW